MLCALCWFMLRGQEHYKWRGSFDLNFEHHKSVRSLRKAANSQCRICMALRDQFPHRLSERWYHDDKPLTITAGLREQPLRTHDDTEQAVYRLDFRLACDSFRGSRTFILVNTGKSPAEIPPEEPWLCFAFHWLIANKTRKSEPQISHRHLQFHLIG